MSRTVTQIKENLSLYKFNPVGLARAGLGMLEEAFNGELEFVDATNPVVATISGCATMVSSFIEEDHVLSRKEYPYAAQTMEDLYAHMSDNAHHDRFAKPSFAEFVFIFDVQELEKRMIVIDSSGTALITIPRNSKIKIGDTVFSLQYPIDIRRFATGGYRVTIDNSVMSPLRIVYENNIPNATVSPTEGVRYLTFPVRLDQFDIVSKTMHVNASSVNVMSIAFEDELYAVRVWMKNDADRWQELAITYTDTIYPISKPTICVKEVNNVLTVKIPQIYISSGLISGPVRIDLYHTKGDIGMNLENYTSENYEVEWLAIDKSEMTAFAAPITTIRNVMIYSKDIVRGGARAMNFNELYDRVISNSVGDPTTPITPGQIAQGYERAGFKLTRAIDNISDRAYMATRTIPAPRDKTLLTSCSGGVETFNDTIDSISSVNSVRINEDQATILPSTIFKRDGGRITAASQEEVDRLNSLSGDQLPAAVSSGDYLFTPFHYVMDTSDNTFEARAYWLNNPTINWRTYIEDNPTTLLNVVTAFSSVEAYVDGYNVYVTTSSSDQYKMIPNAEVFAQILFKNELGVNYVIDGVIQGVTDEGERIFKFTINTSFMLNKSGQIEVVNFYNQNYGNVENTMMGLVQEFEIIYGTTTQMPQSWERSQIDTYVGSANLIGTPCAITHERTSIYFGEQLTNLWTRSRSVVSEEFYERYETDVYATHDTDVLEVDPETKTIFSFDENGQIQYNNVKKAGQIALNENGKPIVKHFAGTIKLDAFGQKIVADKRKIRRQFDMMVLDGVYFFANAAIAKEYIHMLSREVVLWVNTDLPTFDKSLLELTRVYFYPTKNTGLVDVMYNNGSIATIDSAQSFNVILYVSESLYDNDDLREATRKNTISAIEDGLRNGKVAKSDLSKFIGTVMPDSVLGIEINNFGVNGDYQILSMLDTSQSLSIKKRLTYRNDGSLSVVDDVNVTFIKHDVSTVNGAASL